MILGLQTFTIRNLIQDEEMIDKILKDLNQLGIKYLELAYVPFTLAYANMLKKYVDKYDMKVISSQLKLKVIQRKFNEVMAVHKLLNIKYMAISVIPFRYLLTGPPGLKRLGNILNKLGKKVREHQLQLMYHHHNYEFIKFGRRTALDFLVSYFDPKYVQILADTYWIKKGKYDVITFFKTYESHIKAVHLRGYLNKQDSNLIESTIDFIEVINYMNTHKYDYGVIEQNTKNEIKEISKSISYLIENGFGPLLGGKKDV